MVNIDSHLLENLPLLVRHLRGEGCLCFFLLRLNFLNVFFIQISVYGLLDPQSLIVISNVHHFVNLLQVLSEGYQLLGFLVVVRVDLEVHFGS